MTRTNSRLTGYRDLAYAPNPKGAGKMPKREKFGWEDPGPEGTFMWIDKGDLHVDHKYQRELKSKQKVVDIANSFDWVRFGVITVMARPDDVWVVVDGQHRWMASLYRDDVDSIPCIVFDAKEIGDEAETFWKVNTHRSSVSSYQKHRAQLLHDHEVAVKAQEIVEKHGYDFTNHSDTQDTIKAVARVHRIVQRDPGLADKIVGLAADICAGEQISSRLLMALTWVGSNDDRLFQAVHRDRLIDTGLEVIEAEMQRHYALVGKGGKRTYGEALLKIINKGRRTNRLCDDE